MEAQKRLQMKSIHNKVNKTVRQTFIEKKTQFADDYFDNSNRLTDRSRLRLVVGLPASRLLLTETRTLTGLGRDIEIYS